MMMTIVATLDLGYDDTRHTTKISETTEIE